MWYTVDFRYLEVQGTRWNTSRYPYFEISDLHSWGKINRTTTFHKWICNLTPEVRDILKIVRKKEKLILRSNFSSFSQYFVTWCQIYMLKAGTRFSLRDKRLFDISEVEITRVDCIKTLKKACNGTFLTWVNWNIYLFLVVDLLLFKMIVNRLLSLTCLPFI